MQFFFRCGSYFYSIIPLGYYSILTTRLIIEIQCHGDTAIQPLQWSLSSALYVTLKITLPFVYCFSHSVIECVCHFAWEVLKSHEEEGLYYWTTVWMQTLLSEQLSKLLKQIQWLQPKREWSDSVFKKSSSYKPVLKVLKQRWKIKLSQSLPHKHPRKCSRLLQFSYSIWSK